MTHYTRSDGTTVPIADMNPHHLGSALAKLKRDRTDDCRDEEIAAMSARLAEIEEEDVAAAEAWEAESLALAEDGDYE